MRVRLELEVARESLDVGHLQPRSLLSSSVRVVAWLCLVPAVVIALLVALQ